MRINPDALINGTPIGQLMQMARGNIQAVVPQLVTNHPQQAQIMQLIGGRSGAEIDRIAEQACRACGVTPEDVLRQAGILR